MQTDHKRADIQVLRAIAVSLVLLHHAQIEPFGRGYLGVDMFFVISGFVITSSIRRALLSGEFSILDFYGRRVRRIVPATLVTALATACLAPVFLASLEYLDFKAQLWGVLTFTTNFVLLKQSGYFDLEAQAKPLLHMWSLAVEEQFYLVFPWLALLTPIRRWHLVFAGLSMASLVLAALMTTRFPTAAFYMLPTRAWELGIGALAACSTLRLPRMSRSGSMLVVVMLVCIFAVATVAPSGRLLLPNALAICLLTMGIILAGCAAPFRTPFVKPMVWIGDLSFSLYLVHWPIMSFLHNAAIGDVPTWARWASLGGSLACAVALHYLVERPCLAWRLAPRRMLAVASTASVVVCAVQLGVQSISRPSIDFVDLRRPNYGLDRSCDTPTFRPTRACATSLRPKTLLWGDSYAMHLAPGLLRHVDGGLAQATFSACAPLQGLAPINQVQAWSRSCLAFNDGVLTYLASAEDVETVILAGSFALYTDAGSKVWRRPKGSDALDEVATGHALAVLAFARTVNALQQLGKRVMIVAPAPTAGTDAASCVERLLTGKITWPNANPTCAISKSNHEALMQQMRAVLGEIGTTFGVEVVNLDRATCDGEACRAILDGVPLYRDAWHLSYAGSEKIFDVLAGQGVRWSR